MYMLRNTLYIVMYTMYAIYSYFNKIDGNLSFVTDYESSLPQAFNEVSELWVTFEIVLF